MPFFLRDSYESKIAKKCFKMLNRLDRIKVPHPGESEIVCLLCDDSSLMLQNMLFCTDESVYYMTFPGVALDKYDFSSISAVTLEVVHSFSSVCLTISNGGTSKLYVATKEAVKMADHIKSKLSRSTPVPSAADEILKYKNLLDCGAITEAEFDAKKKQLLSI